MKKVYKKEEGEIEDTETETETVSTQSQNIHFKPQSFQGTNDGSFLAQTFLLRLDSLNALVRRRSSLSLQRIFANPTQECQTLQHQPTVSQETNIVHSIENNATSNHSLATRDSTLPQTDAGRRLELLFERYRAESEDNPKEKRDSKKRRGLNRTQVKRGERRKISIQTLQNQLTGISTRNMSRSANTVQFRLKRNNGKIIQNRAQIDEVADEEFPISIDEHEMNPDLLLTLSCEKLFIDRGKRLLKAVVLHEISKKLFVLMYWFIHCRFFQVRDEYGNQYCLICSEQNLTLSFMPIEKLEL